MLQKKMYVIISTFSTFNTFNLQDTKFSYKILGFEASFNQLKDKVRRNVKLRGYLRSVKLD